MIDRCRRSLSPDALGDAAFVVVAAVLFPVVAVEGWDRGTGRRGFVGGEVGVSATEGGDEPAALPASTAASTAGGEEEVGLEGLAGLVPVVAEAAADAGDTSKLGGEGGGGDTAAAAAAAAAAVGASTASARAILRNGLVS